MIKAVWGAALGAMLAAGSGPGTAAAQSPEVKTGVDAWGRGEYRVAVEKWRPLAVAGDADAQFNLGQAYKLGRGVPEDPALAESWFRRAALQGHMQAEDNYGLALFQVGRRADAVPWLEKSVARGEPRAQLVLGTMLFNGDGVVRDHPRAYALMTRASAAGLASASQTLAQMDGNIAPADRQRGLELARRYESQTRLAAISSPQATGMRPPVEERPRPAATPSPSPTPAPKPALKPRPAATPSPKPSPTPAAPRPTPGRVRPGAPIPQEAARPKPPAPRATPTPGAAAPGGYRVQLGAFREPGNARALWAKVGTRVGGQASFQATGGVTRLQAGPYRTRAEAQRACAKAGTACVVIAP